MPQKENSKFCQTVVLDNKEGFSSFDKDKDRLDYFLWKFTEDVCKPEKSFQASSCFIAWVGTSGTWFQQKQKFD